MKFAKAAAVVALSAQVAACATDPSHIGGTYVSPVMYSNYDCAQLSQEMQRIAYKVDEVTGQQRAKATSDQVAMGVGLVLFWPALFFLAAGTDHKAELQSLKGSYDAINEAAIQKRCTGAGQQAATSPAPAPAVLQPAVQVQPVPAASPKPQAEPVAPPVRARQKACAIRSPDAPDAVSC